MQEVCQCTTNGMTSSWNSPIVMLVASSSAVHQSIIVGIGSGDVMQRFALGRRICGDESPLDRAASRPADTRQGAYEPAVPVRAMCALLPSARASTRACRARSLRTLPHRAGRARSPSAAPPVDRPVGAPAAQAGCRTSPRSADPARCAGDIALGEAAHPDFPTMTPASCATGPPGHGFAVEKAPCPRSACPWPGAPR